MEEDRGKAFTHLYAALGDYQSKFIDNSLKACGFYLLVMGWLVTSDKARALAEASGFNRGIAIFGLLVAAGGQLLLAVQTTRTMRQLFDELQALQYFPQTYYDFRRLKPHVAFALTALALGPCAVIVMYLLSLQTKTP